jgi:hypothetical protein
MCAALSEVDRQNFFRLHISEDVLRRAGIDRAEDGVRFPYRPLPNGNPDPPTWTYRTRLDGDAKPKYKSEPDRHRLYFAPVNPEWVKDQNALVILAESEKATLTLLSFAEEHRLRMLPVGLGGCWGFSGTRGVKITESGERVVDKGPLADLEVCRNRDVYIWLDRNMETSPAVFSAQKALVEALREFGPREIRIVHFPAGCPERVNGPDDLASLVGFAPFFKIIFQNSELVGDIVAAKPAAFLVADMPQECLDGSLGELCATYLDGFPRGYSWPVALAYASATIPRDPANKRTNVYAPIIGPTHSGKTQVELWLRGLLDIPDSVLIRSYVGSGEQFAPLADASGNARLFAPGELAHTLRKMQIERSSLPQFFTRIFDEDHFGLTQSRHGNRMPDPVTVNCHLSIVGGIVEDEFEDLFGTATTRGFYDRCLFGLCPSGHTFHYREFPEDWRGIGERIPEPVKVADEVWDALKEWRKANDVEHHRVIELCLRAAWITAAYDRRKVLTAAQLKPALALAEYQTKVRVMLRPSNAVTLDGRIEEAIMRYMRRLSPGEGVKQRELFDRANIYRLGSPAAARVLNVLVANGKLCESPGKRRDTRLIYLPNLEENSESR